MRIPAENVKLIAYQGCDFAHIFTNIPSSILDTSSFIGLIKSNDGTTIADFEITPNTGGISITLTGLETALMPIGTYEYAIVQTQSDATIKFPFIIGYIEVRGIAL